jgi:hypothetical protein
MRQSISNKLAIVAWFLLLPGLASGACPACAGRLRRPWAWFSPLLCAPQAKRAEGNLRDFDQHPRGIVYRQVLDWKDHQRWNVKP